MTAQPTDKQAETRRRWIIGASALFVAAMIGSAAHDLWTSRREAERQAEQEIVVLARVLAEQTRRSLQTVDVMLREIAEAHRAEQSPPVGSPQLDDYLELQRSQEGNVSSVFLTDAEGRRMATSSDAPAAIATPDSVGDWPGFARLRSDPAATTVVERAARLSRGRSLEPAHPAPRHCPQRPLRRLRRRAARHELLRALLCGRRPWRGQRGGPAQQ